MAPSVAANAFGRLYSFWLFCRSDFITSHVCCINVNVRMQSVRWFDLFISFLSCFRDFCVRNFAFSSGVTALRHAWRHGYTVHSNTGLWARLVAVVVVYNRVVAMPSCDGTYTLARTVGCLPFTSFTSVFTFTSIPWSPCRTFSATIACTVAQSWNRVSGSPGQQFGPGRVGSRVSSTKTWPGYLTRILVQCCETFFRQNVRSDCREQPREWLQLLTNYRRFAVI